QRLQPSPHEQVWLQSIAAGLAGKTQRMLRPAAHDVIHVGAKNELLIAAAVLDLHLDGQERSIVDRDVDLLNRGHEVGAAVRVPPQDAGKELHKGFAPDRAVLIKPCAVGPDPHSNVPAVGRVPLLHRRKPVSLSRLDEFIQALNAHVCALACLLRHHSLVQYSINFLRAAEVTRNSSYSFGPLHIVTNFAAAEFVQYQTQSIVEAMTTLTHTDDDIVARIEAAGERMSRVHKATASVIFGQDLVIEQTLITILAGGHGLLIGVPGLAKTLLVETLGKVLGLEAKRIQFTPDLMPSDISGSEVLDEIPGERRSFRFIAGPIFTQLLMADEINRASPKTQSALLQAMQEHHVTVAGQRYDVPQPFHVLATQNPLEQEGTYPL